MSETEDKILNNLRNQRMEMLERSALIKSINILHEALSFYANTTNWVAREGGGGLRVDGHDCEDNISMWGFSGRRARNAIEECKNIKAQYEEIQKNGES